MPPQATNSQGEAASRISPLFRPEALAAQESGHGEILLIRPLSLTFLIWLGILLGAGMMGFLFLGRITETVQVEGTLLPRMVEGQGSATAQPEAAFNVPADWASSLQPGTSLDVRCPGCTNPGRRLDGRVIRVDSPAQGSAVQVTVALPSSTPSLLSEDLASSSAGLAAEIPLGRTSLIHWLLKPSPR